MIDQAHISDEFRSQFEVYMRRNRPIVLMYFTRLSSAWNFKHKDVVELAVRMLPECEP